MTDTERVIAIRPRSEAHLLVTEHDLARVDAARADGLVLGHRDWESPGHLDGDVVCTRLGTA